MQTLRIVLAVAFLWIASSPSLALDDGLQVPQTADAKSAVSDGGPRARARLVIHADPTSQQGFVGVVFDLDPGWHVYWRDPGDSGLAPKFTWSFGAATVAVGDVAWPTPHRFAEDSEIVTYGYEDQVLLAAPFSQVEGPSLSQVSVEVDALVCANQCIPASFALTRPYPTSHSASAEAATQALFEGVAARIPVDPRQAGVKIAVEWPASLAPGQPETGSLRIEDCGKGCALSQISHAEFFPITPDSLRVISLPFERGADAASLVLGIEQFEEQKISRLEGVLRFVTDAGVERTVQLDQPLRMATTTPAGPAPQPKMPTLWKALLLGFLGGLLLNLMPCVLPVLAIKIFAIAEMAHRSRREVWSNAGAYTFGILASLFVLASAVIALRMAGTAVGWGFQLQDPRFVAAISAVVVVFALNLFGIFEITLDSGRLGQVGMTATGARRSFFDGLLAVTLATPCSAPFLGPAVGFAFASSAPVIVAIFLSIGLGLAAPFVAIAMVPGLSRWMPKPGAWMVELRRGLGFALLATAVWLLSVVGRAAGIGAMTEMLALLLAIAFATWIFGTLQRSRQTSSALLITAVTVALFGGLDAIDFSPQAATSSLSEAGERSYTPEALAETLANGNPAFVYYTADWCLTCKVNERRVLAKPAVRAALAEAGLTVFRADWTRRDESIRLELAKLGRAGVPVYALYRPEAPDAPELLPELLSLQSFIQSVRETADATERTKPRAG